MSASKKAIVVSLGAIVLSTLGIQASDTLRGLDSNLTGLINETTGPCGEGAVQLLFGSHSLCVDVYEASAGSECPNSDQASQSHTQENINESDCRPVSQPEVSPWRFVSLTQAQQLCARSGKRLPTNDEWYKIASGLADESSCVTEGVSGPKLTGIAGCVTPAGVNDVVGNLWEWVDEEVVNGVYKNRDLPDSGYVSLVDSNGVVVNTDNQPHVEFGDDYAWTKTEGVFGVIRGGFYGSEEDAGIFAQNLSVPLDFKTAGVGFRCVKDI